MVVVTVTGSTDRVIKPAYLAGVRMSHLPEHVHIQAGSDRYPRFIPMRTPIELDQTERSCLEDAGFTVTPVEEDEE